MHRTRLSAEGQSGLNWKMESLFRMARKHRFFLDGSSYLLSCGARQVLERKERTRETKGARKKGALNRE
jgi:hypothetical protein